MDRPAAALVLAAAFAACQPVGGPGARGGAAPVRLEGTSWRLVEIRSMDDAQGTTRPDDPARYTLAFSGDGRVFARLDCNRGNGPWRQDPADAASGSLAIGPLATTKALCPPPTLGDRLARDLGDVRSYLLRGGRLHLSLMADGGILVWEPAEAAR